MPAGAVATLPLFPHLPRPRGPRVQAVPLPVRPGRYGFARAGVAKCMARVLPAGRQRRRQCRLYAVGWVGGVAYCRLHRQRVLAEGGSV